MSLKGALSKQKYFDEKLTKYGVHRTVKFNFLNKSKKLK